jgi:uncharacterized membrane protein YdjX (TVP38/TMEM64 family)
MKIFYAWAAFVLVILFVYLFYALPPLNTAKASELWGQQNKWMWYLQFCAVHFLYAALVIAVGGGIIALIKKFVID